DAQYGFVANAAAAAHSFAPIPENEGTFRYRVLATDGNNLSALSAESAPVVVDQTGPGAPAATADRAPDFAGGDGWYADTVTVSFTGAVDPLLQDGSAGSGVAQYTVPQVFTTSGEHTASGKATDYAGNDSVSSELTVFVDADDPLVAFPVCPADVLLLSDAQASWEASDAHSGLATAASGTETLDTSSIATRSVVASATDNVAHEGSAECAYRVVFAFSGFFKPVNNPPAQSEFSAGDVVPITFALDGDQGMNIMAPAYPHSEAIACGTNPELEAGSPTSAARELMYKRGNGGRYTYFWATEAGWAGTCRQLIVKLTDGTYHRANVSLL
ncbi:MAG TPA: PxKF domain-containing protein, partial [Xanthomonadales bacterium]|nr:PxKF domain-containing protein [Xanthomonadales bacterium]